MFAFDCIECGYGFASTRDNTLFHADQHVQNNPSHHLEWN